MLIRLVGWGRGVLIHKVGFMVCAAACRVWVQSVKFKKMGWKSKSFVLENNPVQKKRPLRGSNVLQPL